MQVEEIKNNYDLGLFGDTLKRIVLKEYPHRLTDFIDSFSSNQLICKKWLVSELLHLINSKQINCKKVTILGSWYGNLIVPLLADNIEGIETIELIDMDEDALAIGRKFLGRKYNNVDINYIEDDINFSEFENHYTNIVINTSCEHMIPMNSFNFKNDKDVLYVLQSNDMFGVREHVNCVKDTDEFIKQSGLSKTYYHGKKRLIGQDKEKYWRFMIIGRRDD